MAFLNMETGEITFTDGFRLGAGLVMGELASALNGAVDGVVRLSPHTAGGGLLIPVCAVQGGALQSVTLSISSVGNRPMRKAERQREFLFARLSVQDPFPDTYQPVHITCPFGELHLSTDPYTGRTEARIIYTVQ